MPVSYLPYSGIAIIIMIGILSVAELVKYVKSRQQKHPH